MLSSCGIYSFSGASVSPDTKTVNVKLFENNAPIVIPALSRNLTEGLKDKIINQTALSVLNNPNADLVFEGQIIDYSVKPIAIQGNETAAQNRLTITIKVTCTDSKKEDQSWESNFSRFIDFAGADNLSTVQDELIRQINEQLVEDVFNKAFVNW